MKLTRMHYDFYAANKFKTKGALMAYAPKHVPSVHTLINSQVKSLDQGHEVQNTYTLVRSINRREGLIKSGTLEELIQGCGTRWTKRLAVLQRIKRAYNKANERRG